jgi:hypothetical protein
MLLSLLLCCLQPAFMMGHVSVPVKRLHQARLMQRTV